MKIKILILDDDRAVCSSLKLLLKKKGYETKAIHHPSLALETLEAYNPALILLDMNFTIDTSGKQGLSILKKIVQGFPQTSVILMTGWATVQLAVEGMKLGAKDFLAKPWDNQHLIESIESILQLHSYPKSSATVQEEDFSLDNIIGSSEKMKQIIDMVQRVAKTNASVLITGESGTGKEMISEAIHELSNRHQNEFVKVNLGGLSSTLFESEMFGHKKGAFTGAVTERMGRFEKANGGTIFLDEIGELPLENQVKLLRVLQEKTYEPLGSSHSKKTDVRVISATNKNLQNMSIEGTFREDLYYRINLITIHIPALKERKEDIPLLVDHFVQSTCRAYDIPTPILDDRCYQWLKSQEFPGNIRQLKNMVERTILLHMNERLISIKHFQDNSTEPQTSSNITLPDVGKVTLEELEINMIRKALNFHNQSISKTAKALGITRSSLYRRLEKYNIDHESQN